MRSHAADDITPDGSALSHEGNLINALFGHGCLSRYCIRHGTLTLAKHVLLPVTQPSCCVFGSPGGTRRCLSPRRVSSWRPPGELDGTLLQVATDTRGAPTYRFRFD